MSSRPKIIPLLSEYDFSPCPNKSRIFFLVPSPCPVKSSTKNISPVSLLIFISLKMIINPLIICFRLFYLYGHPYVLLLAFLPCYYTTCGSSNDSHLSLCLIFSLGTEHSFSFLINTSHSCLTLSL